MARIYTWIPFYMEFADKLRTYQNDRPALIQKIADAFESIGISLPKLEKDGMMPVDIDPFTVYGLFNKGIKESSRIAIIRKFAEVFNISAEIPSDFNGVPVLNNLKATYYWFIDERKENDIENLWDVFTAALDYTNRSTELGLRSFCKAYNQAIMQQGVRWNLSMGLYWIRPYRFISLDSRNLQYLISSDDVSESFREHIKELSKNVPLAEEYLQICEGCRWQINNNKSKYIDFPSLSYYAWQQTKENQQPQEETEWFPSPEEYTPELSVEDWSALLNNSDVFDQDSLNVIRAFYEIGGQATCSELAEKNGENANYYRNIVIHLAKRIYKETNCPLIPDELKDNAKWWTILFVGKYADKKQKGIYIWKMREELKTAFNEHFDNSVHAWLLAWNPDNYDWGNMVGEYSFDHMINKVKNGGAYLDSWRCSNTSAKAGDRIFITRLSAAPKGIIATGYAVSDSYQSNEGTSIVDIIITKALDFRKEEIFQQSALKEKFPDQHWSPRGSGISIKPDAAKWLIDNWQSFQNNENNSKDNTSQNEPVIWKISHETNSNGIPEHLRPVFEDRKVVVVNQGTMRLAAQKYPQGEAYMKEIKKGDYFFLCYAGEIVLFGQFTEDEPKLNQEMVREWNDYEWYERAYRVIARSLDHEKYTGKKKIWTSNFNSTCVKVTDNALFEKLILQPYFGLKLADLSTAEYHEPYSEDDFLRDVYMSKQQYHTLTSLLEHRLNVILQGAPGIGKTYAAKRLAYAMMGKKDDSRIAFVQFHQSYSYEDYIMGYRPADDGTFALKEGIFYRFCETARNDPDRAYFFIIDEINRGNLSKIFGELLMLIEKDYRNETAVLAYTGAQFSVPENLYIIGMMNTADRSLAMIDYALRRRFSFFDMNPGFDSDGFKAYSGSLQNDVFDALIGQVKLLNQAIENDSSLGKGFQIGHSYFCNLDAESCTEERLHAIVEYDIIPMLNEYWFDDKDSVKKWTENLRGVFHDK